MKTKVTRKCIKESFSTIISVNYASLQHLLTYETPQYYCTRAQDWACDIYIFGNVAIVTGYDPFGNVEPSHELRKEVDWYAENILSSSHRDYQKKKEILRRMIDEFIRRSLLEKRFKKKT